MTLTDTAGETVGASSACSGSGWAAPADSSPSATVAEPGGVLAGRSFAAVAIAWGAAAPYRRRLVAAVGRRVAALGASGVDVIVIGRDGSVPGELRAGCRVARADAGPEVMRGILAVLARRGVGPGLLLVVGGEFGGRGGNRGPDAALLVPEAASMAAYNPMSYHNGSVWPHDNALCAAGLMRYGFAAHAQRVAEAVFGAAAHFG
jgi:hypothetical protein